jgi:hypothetical protein
MAVYSSNFLPASICAMPRALSTYIICKWYGRTVGQSSYSTQATGRRSLDVRGNNKEAPRSFVVCSGKTAGIFSDVYIISL